MSHGLADKVSCIMDTPWKMEHSHKNNKFIFNSSIENQKHQSPEKSTVTLFTPNTKTPP